MTMIPPFGAIRFEVRVAEKAAFPGSDLQLNHGARHILAVRDDLWPGE
jgi:hypothetical protein